MVAAETAEQHLLTAAQIDLLSWQQRSLSSYSLYPRFHAGVRDREASTAAFVASSIV